MIAKGHIAAFAMDAIDAIGLRQARGGFLLGGDLLLLRCP